MDETVRENDLDDLLDIFGCSDNVVIIMTIFTIQLSSIAEMFAVIVLF